MLLMEEFFKTFIKKEIADATKTTESLICLSADSRENVDELIAKAVAAGGMEHIRTPDHGFMYQHAYQI